MASQRPPSGPRLLKAPSRPCQDFAEEECRRGDRCVYDHHANLDPALQASREWEYMVPNELGTACQRCMGLGLRCDKKDRAKSSSDPCSQCRWFGGSTCICELAHTTSYNDALWRVMLGRGIAGFTLPEAKRYGHDAQGLSTQYLKRGWQGLTREQARRDAPLIPGFVRARPRAYLVPPRPTVAQQSVLARLPVSLKRKREVSEDGECLDHDPAVPTALPKTRNVESTVHRALPETQHLKSAVHTALPEIQQVESVVSAAPLEIPKIKSEPLEDAQVTEDLPAVQSALEPPRPGSYPALGELTTSSYCWKKKRWTHAYSTGAVLHL